MVSTPLNVFEVEKWSMKLTPKEVLMNFEKFHLNQSFKKVTINENGKPSMK